MSRAPRLRKKQKLAIEFMKRIPDTGESVAWDIESRLSKALPLKGFISSQVRGPAADGAAERARDAWFGRAQKTEA